MSIKTGVRVSEGLVALEEGPTLLAETLDRVCARWARTSGAVALTVPPLLPVTDLAMLDVYRNVPQLALVSSALDVVAAGAEQIEQEAASGYFGPASLRTAGLALPSSACYGVYLHSVGAEQRPVLARAYGQRHLAQDGVAVADDIHILHAEYRGCAHEEVRPERLTAAMTAWTDAVRTEVSQPAPQQVTSSTRHSA
jgi:hypothetical protein